MVNVGDDLNGHVGLACSRRANNLPENKYENRTETTRNITKTESYMMDGKQRLQHEPQQKLK